MLDALKSVIQQIPMYKVAPPLFVASVTMNDGTKVSFAFIAEIDGVGAVVRREGGNEIDFLNYGNISYVRVDNVSKDFQQKQPANAVAPGPAPAQEKAA